MAASTARPAVATKAASKPAVGSKSGPIPNLGTNDLVESYVPARLPEGMVTGVWGRAIIRPAGGQPRPLVVGDEVRKGDMILTSQNGIVQIKHDGTRLARVPDGESLENVIVAVNTGDAPPGAGGASGGSLQPGLRVDRLYEVVSAQDYAFDATQAGTGLAVRADVDNGVPTVATVEPGAPGAGDDAVPEGTAAANTLVYTVTLTRATTTVLTLPISIGGGTASADDYSGTATFSNGVTRNADGTLNVPAGVSSFTISIPTAPDATVEVDETVPVVVGGVLGTGVITNDDTAPVAADDAGAVTQDAQLTVSATDGVILSSTVAAGRDLDVDLDPLTVTAVRTGAEAGSGTAGSVGAALVGTYGSLTLNANGSYSYVADRADALGLGATALDTFTYTVSDGHGNTDSAQLVITVTGTNDVPVTVGSLADQTSQDGAAVTFPTASGFTDPDSGDTLAYSASGLPSGLSIDPTTGVISGTLPSNASVTDPYTIVVTASDGHGGSVTQTFTLTVTNPPPVAANDAGAVTEDSSLSVTAANGVVLSGSATSGRDADPDGDTLTVTSVRTGAETGSGTAGTLGTALVGTYGSLTLNADGSYTYVANNANALALGATALDTFTYTVSDGQGGSDSAQLVITVTGANDVPVTVGSLADQTSQDGAAVTFPTASGFTDPDSGDTLAYSASGLPSGLSIDPTTGVISGTLPSNASVTDPYAIVVTASDGHGGSVTQTFTLTVTNPPPVAANDAGAVTEDSSLSVTAANGVVLSGSATSGRDADPDGDTLTVTSVRTGAETGSGTTGTLGTALVGTYGSLTLNADGSYTYVANNANALALGATALDTFTYTVSDGQGGSDSAQLVITVTGANDVPVTVGSLADQTSQDGAAVTFPTASGFTDPDSGDTLAYSASGLPSGLSIDPTTGVISGTLPSNASVTDPYTIVVTASDGHGGSVTQTFTLTVTNPPPVAANDAGAVTEDSSLSVTAANGVVLSGSATSGRDADPDGDTLTVTSVRTGAETGSGTTGTLGTALVGTYGSLTLNADGSYTYVANNANALALGATALDTFTYTVSDGQGGSDSAQLVITVTGANDVPVTVGSLADQTSQDGAAVTFPTASGFTDPDSGDTLAYSASGLPSGLSIDPTTGVISGTLPSNASVTDPYTIVVTASDGHGGSVTQTFTLTVTNPPPVAANDAGAVTEDSSLSVTAANGVVLSGSATSGRDADPDGDTLTVTSVRTGAETGSGTTGTLGTALVGTYGSLTLNADGSYTYVANNANALALGATALDTFTYTVSDGQGGSDSAQLVITVTGTNDAPVPQADGLGATGNGTNEDTSASGNVLNNDQDADTPAADLRIVSFTIAGVGDSTVYSAGTTVTISGVGRFTLAADGSYSFVPAADYNNTSATAPVVHYTLTDGLAEATSQLKLQVTAVRDAIIDSESTWENRPVVIDLLDNDKFADSTAHITHLNGQAVTAGTGAEIPVLQNGVQVGTVSLGSDGKVTFEPATGYTNTVGNEASFTYTVSAGSSSETASVYIQVDPAIALSGLTPTKYWTFDNASGSTVSDESATTQQGTLTGGATLSAGHIGQAVVLNGSSGYVNLANASTTTNLLEGKGGMSASLAFWVKLDPGQTGGSVIGANSASTIDPGSNLGWGQVSADGHIGLVRGNQAVFGSTAINDGQWHHVVISYAQSPTDSKIQSATIWVDGSLDGSGFTFADGLLNVEFTGFGINNAKAATDGTSTYFKGTLDDIRVYSGVLTEDQVLAIHTAEAAQSGNSSADRLVLDNDQGSVSFAVAGNPLFIHLSGVPNGAKLTDGVNEVTIGTSGEASITNPASWNLQSLSLEGLGSRSALVSVDATLSDGSTVGKMTIDVVAGHSATTSTDTWTSGSGSDVFAWTLADAGASGSPGQDTIAGFNASSTKTAGGDVLDLRDLLVGEHAAAGAYNLENFLHVELPSGSATSTTLHVSSNGGFAGGNYAAGQETQVIELTQTQLASALGLATDATESAILKAMVEQGKLVVDP